jgi:hypothetical protein
MNLDPHLTNGLRPYADLPKDALFMQKMRNIMATERRGKQLPTFSWPVGFQTLGSTFPHAELFYDDRVALAAIDSALYTVDPSALTTTAITTYGPEGNVLTNGTFTGALTGWTEASPDIAYGTNNVAFVNATATLKQLLASMTTAWTAAATYRVVFTISGYSGGGNITVGTNTNAAQGGSAVTANGTYTRLVTADAHADGLVFTATGFTGNLDTVTATRVFTNTTGDAYQFASFLDIWFATNNSGLVWRIPGATQGNTVGSSTTVCKGVANWNNRLVLIGVSGAAVSNASFLAAVNKWKKKQKVNVVTAEDDAFDTSWIIIGPPVLGESDVPASGLMALLGYPSETFYYDKYEPIVSKWIEQGMLDFLPMRHTGAGLAGKQHGNDLIIYGTEGVSKVTGTEVGPVETKLLDVGIPFNGCYAGDEKEHVFVSKHNEMFFLGERGQSFPEAKSMGNGLYRLGYAEYLSTLTLTAARMTFDPTERYFWVCDADEAFVLSRTGLSNPKGLFPVSVIRTPGYNGLVGSSVSAQADDVEMQPHPFGMGRSDAFEIFWWDMRTSDTAATAADRWKVTPIAKLHKQNAFTTFTSYAKLFDVRGRAEVTTTGIEHQPSFTAADRTAVDCDGLQAFISAPGAAPSMRMWMDA